VLAVARSEIEIGGAGNVARNIGALGAQCIFVGLIGKDDAARTLTEAFARLNGSVTPHLIVEVGRHTTRKVRFVSEHHSAHLIRADWETARPATPTSETAVIAHAEAVLPRCGAVVLSDYAKGVLTPRVIRAIIDRARQLGKPVIVDPKSHDYSIYRGATLITPNRQEVGTAVHRPVTTEAEIGEAAAELARIVDSEAVLVTRSEEGMTLHVAGHAPLHIPAYPVKVRDVSGAGRRDGRSLGDERAVRGGYACGKRGCRRGGRQARYRDRDVDRIAPPHPAVGDARAGGQDPV
jgi:D-beta-D-heptose 7-phosphate kinase/D-beta-D-heptose 1-phosphate adenosyltransferase